MCDTQYQRRASSVVPSSVPRVHRKFRFRIFKYQKMSDHNSLFRNSRIDHNIFLASLKHLSKEQEFSVYCVMSNVVHNLYNLYHYSGTIVLDFSEFSLQQQQYIVYSICLSSPEVVFVEWFRIRKIPFRIPRNFKLNSENSEKSSTNCSARLCFSKYSNNSVMRQKVIPLSRLGLALRVSFVKR